MELEMFDYYCYLYI